MIFYQRSPTFSLVWCQGPEDLEPKTPKTPSTPRSNRAPRVPATPKTPRGQSLLAPPTPGQVQILRRSDPSSSGSPTPPSPAGAITPTRLDANAPAFVPSSQMALRAAAATVQENDEASIKSRILASYGQSDSSEANSGKQTPELDDLHGEYVRLKLQIDGLTTHRHQLTELGDHLFLEELKQRLAEVQKHYWFDKVDAEQLYREARSKADENYLQARLRGEVPVAPKTSPVPLASKKRPPHIQSPPTQPASASPDNADSGSEGGMFELLEGPPKEETQNGVTIPVRDLGLPKQWGGRPPKVLLAETVSKVDRYAVVTYRCISGSSRAKRAAVSIRGDGSKDGTWQMDGIACQDIDQAEQYIATIALHALTFPTSEGFASGNTSSAGGGQTFFRLLPAVFRDIWDELEAKRKDDHDAINRAIWSKLRSIIEVKMGNQQEASSALYIFYH